MALSEEYRRRTVEALNETRGLLLKALAYLPQNRDERLIAFYRQHIAKLEAILRRS